MMRAQYRVVVVSTCSNELLDKLADPVYPGSRQLPGGTRRVCCRVSIFEGRQDASRLKLLDEAKSAADRLHREQSVIENNRTWCCGDAGGGWRMLS
jgi:hypothetical protein